MKKNSAIIIFVIITFATLNAQNKYSTFYDQRATLFEKLPVSAEDIVFVGNSITNGGEWSELFNDMRVKNRGISGDICMGVYDRLDAILGGQPAKLFLLIGINDLGRNTSPDTVVTHIKKVVDKIITDSPKTKIYLQSILPVNDSFRKFEGHTKHWKEIKPLNKKLFRLACSKQITYIDLFADFVTPGTEKLDPKFTNDGLHLLGEGYLKWAEIVKPYIIDTEK